jgi:hypothetical protein
VLGNLLGGHDRVAVYGDRPVKRRFLVNYDYGMGGAWAFLMAESAAEIRKRFRELTVVHDRPSWMTADDVSLLEEKLTLDIDDSSAPILKELLDGRL